MKCLLSWQKKQFDRRIKAIPFSFYACLCMCRWTACMCLHFCVGRCICFIFVCMQVLFMCWWLFSHVPVYLCEHIWVFSCVQVYLCACVCRHFPVCSYMCVHVFVWRQEGQSHMWFLLRCPPCVLRQVSHWPGIGSCGGLNRYAPPPPPVD